MGRDDGDDEPKHPRAAGWYPDPWSATGDGERYFDGKHWGSSARPLARHSNVPKGIQKPVRAVRSRTRSLIGPIVFLLLVAGVYFIQRSHHSSSNVTEIQTPPTTIPTDRPVPAPESATPLGKPAPVPAGNGKYEILETQPSNDAAPVAWDPCREIHYVINPTGAPADGTALIKSAIARVQLATGFHFVYDGSTTEKPSKTRAPFQPVQYSSARWAPLLIAWSDENAYPELAGYIEGIGSPYPEYADNSHLVYVTGELILDRQQLSTINDPDRGNVRAVMLHELGHVVGLDHTADRHEIMFSESQFNVRDYGNGDLQGLAKLGTQPCYPGI